jgi:hypothetical protein
MRIARAMKLSRTNRVIATAIAVVTAWISLATGSDACDTEMICAWKRTFYTYNYLDSPLRPYIMPRIPNCNCWGAPLADWRACHVEVPPMSQGFERLGRIPNDVDLNPVAVGAPAGR